MEIEVKVSRKEIIIIKKSREEINELRNKQNP